MNKPNKKKKCICCGGLFERQELVKIAGIYACQPCIKNAYSLLEQYKEVEEELKEAGLSTDDDLSVEDWLEIALRDPIDRFDDIDAEDIETRQENITVKTPFDIKEHLDRYVIGQEEAKKTLAVAVYNHQKRLSDSSGLLKKSNILLVGPTGCGKTRLAQAVAEVLDVPFAIADASTLTEPGYIGADVETILSRLVTAADGDYKRAEKGIIFVDEIDKVCRRNVNAYGSKGNPGEGVQNALLKMMEGAIVSVPVHSKQKLALGNTTVMMDTKDILFIFGGAFDGMLGNEQEKVLGFGRTVEKTSEGLSPEKVRKFGFSPEFVGRIPVMVQLEELTRDDLVRILVEPEDSVIKEYQKLFSLDGINLSFEADALEAVADLALENKTGARGLRSIIENALLDLMFELPSRHGEGTKSCIITRDMLQKRRRYVC